MGYGETIGWAVGDRVKAKSNSFFVLVVAAILATAGYYVVRQTASAPAARTAGRKIAFYQDSMHPWIKSDHPGKCTICDMDLTPIYEGECGFGMSDNMVVLRSNSITVLHVQTEEVKRQTLVRTLRVAGTLEANESRKTILAAPVACRIEAIAVEYAGVEVNRGQSLITLFTPELVQKRAYFRAFGSTYAGSGLYLAPAGAKQDPFTTDLVAPQDGMVVERSVYPGQYVEEGQKLLTLVDPSVLWFRFDVYEQQLPWLATGQPLALTLASVPGTSFSTVVAFIDPIINEATRTIRVRADIPNPIVGTNGQPHRLLRFGMFAEGHLSAVVPNALAIPRAAVLFPGGDCAFAYVDKGHGAYARHRLNLGRQGDGFWEVLGGLEEGDRVVTSGNVLIDAQAQFDRGGEICQADAGATNDAHPCAAPGEADRAAPCSGGATPLPAEQPPPVALPATPTPAANVPANVAPSNAVGTAAAQPSPANTPTHYQADQIRMPLKDELWKMRLNAIAEAQGRAPTATNAPPEVKP